ncbi:MAG: hypothetical protein LIP10_12945 [Clostridiales bacterium]|nr:hypothetical protein [Clostridiales bacterium]
MKIADYSNKSGHADERQAAIKINSVEASRVYMIEHGYKYKKIEGNSCFYYDTKLYVGNATIPDSLFAQYARKHGCNVNKRNRTYDFVSIRFDYNVSKDDSDPDNIKPYVSADKIREDYYKNGVTITWWQYNRDTGEKIPGTDKTITYRRLMRSPGKAKDGSCIFAKVDDNFCDRMQEYINMGLTDKTSKIVEMSAYSSLVAATALGYITIPTRNIFVLQDETVKARKNAYVVRESKIIKPKMKPDYRAFDERLRQNGYTLYKSEQKKNQSLRYIDRSMGKEKILEMYNIDLDECPKVETGKYTEITGCVMDRDQNVEIENTLWDGMGLIDESIFPQEMNGFIYCRSHFFKSCLFRGNIQQYFKDYFGKKYDTTRLTDYTGRSMRVSDIKVIVTEKSLKWWKFIDVMCAEGEPSSPKTAWKYWRDRMRADKERFAIIKTGHSSFYGDVQKTSYQMINTLLTTDKDVIKRIASTSIDYHNEMQNNDDVFIDYLRKTAGNKYDVKNVLVDLYGHNDKFKYTDFYRDRKTDILSKLRCKMRQGRLFLGADNLTLCGNLIAMLKKATGQKNFLDEGCFEQTNDCIQCYTQQFEDGEYLAAFRSPHNSPNNICYFKNVYPEELLEYFPNLGKNVIVVNGIGTDIQARLNGADYDTDAVFATNQADVVDIARRAYIECPTIVNRIKETGSADYSNDMVSYARMDNKIAGAQMDIGRATNLAQLAQSYWHNSVCEDEKKELEEIFCILSVLAQLAIDSAKRNFNVKTASEIARIAESECMKKEPTYPLFFAEIQDDKDCSRSDSEKMNIGDDRGFYDCPMDILYRMIKEDKLLIDKRTVTGKRIKRIALEDLLNAADVNKRADSKQVKKIKDTIQENYGALHSKQYEKRMEAYDKCMDKIRLLTISNVSMRKLINAFFTDKSMSKFTQDALVMLYDKAPNIFLNCFKKSSKNDENSAADFLKVSA